MVDSTSKRESLLTHPGTLRSIPFAVFVLLMATEPVLVPILPEAFDQRWLYAIRSAAALLALLILGRHFIEIREPPPAYASDWGVGVAMGILIFVLWVNLDVPPLALEGRAGFIPRDGTEFRADLAAVRLAGAVLVIPVVEELFWRSFILRVLQHPRFLQVDPGAVGWGALFVSSAAFATEHRLWFAGFLAGLGYGWLYKRSGNLRIPILAHAITNALLGVYVLTTESWHFW